MGHLFALLGCYLAFALGGSLFLGLVLVCFARKPMLEEDQVTPERPFPGPAVIHLSLGDRLAQREASPAEQLAFRLACEHAAARLRQINEEIERERLVREDIEDLTGPVREGDVR